MKIVFLGTKGVPATFGGVERHVEELGARLAERGHDVTVHCRRSYVGSATAVTYRGMRLVTMPSVATKHLDALSHTALASVSATFGKADIVHYHALGPSIFSFLPRLRRSRATVVSVHGLDHEREKWSPTASRLLRLGEYSAGHFPDATICVSRTLTRHFSEHFPGARVEYIPNGVPVPEKAVPADEIRRAWGLEPGSYVLFMGRFVPEKAPELLMEAFSETDLDMGLVMAGGAQHDPAYEAKIRDLAARDPRILLPGFVSGHVRDELYANAALFVLPSRLEGLPIALLEAMAHGVPVLASDIECHIEVLGSDQRYGRTFRTDDGADLTRALEELPDDSARAERAARAVDLVAAEFDWDDVVEATESLYRDLLERRR